MRCTYCARDVPDAEIVEANTMCTRTHALCAACATHVREVSADWLEAQVLRQDLEHPMEPGQRIDYLTARARAFLRSPFDPSFATLPEGAAAQAVEHEWRWYHLVRSPALSWLPLAATPRVRPAFGEPHEIGVADFDGRRRLSAARAWGYPRVRLLMRPPQLAMPTPERQYQTLVGRDQIVEGERPGDRWAWLPASVLRGARIIELGCNSGMDGILACVCGAESYTGWEVYAPAVEAGRQLAATWGVADRVTLHVADVKATPPEIPRADVVCIFSTAIQVGVEAHVRAVEQSGAVHILLETHLLDDPESIAVMQRLLPPFVWEPLGVCRWLCERDELKHGRPPGHKVRRLFLGTRG